ncbi:MAG TPA: hypothetical protein VGR62_04605 [Candidatus Binatia bacterium]|jgi:hypothetical protein|nr:hypothetical protein [Candidatus Binatia bacterium]
MNVNAVLLARSIRAIEQKIPIYLPDLIGAVQERYGFVRFPTTAREVLPPNDGVPLVFEHGKFERDGRQVLIQRLELLRYAISLDAATSTEDADIVVDDLLAVGSEYITPAGRRFYISHLELTQPGVGIPVPERAVPAIGSVARDLARLLPTYEPGTWANGIPPDAFAVAGFSLLVDPAGAQFACDFRLERRANVPLSSNLFFSQAPLRTTDHIAALERFFEIRDEEVARVTASSSALPPPSSR